MKTVDNIMKSASLLGACNKSNGISDWKSLAWIFFTPQGMEFCEERNFPSIAMFRDMKEHVSEYGVFIDFGNITRSNDSHIGLIGDTSAELVYDENTQLHKIILMHGAKVRIKASNYAVIHILNISGCEVEIEKDETVVIL